MTKREIAKRFATLGYERYGNRWIRPLDKRHKHSINITARFVRHNGLPALIWYCGNHSVGPFNAKEIESALNKHRQIITAFKKAPIGYLT